MAKKKKFKKPKVKEFHFWSILNEFLHSLEALNKALLSVGLMNSIYKAESKKIENFIKTKGKDVKHTGNIFEFKFRNSRDRSYYQKLIKEKENSAIARKTLPEILFVSQITHFDLFVGSIIKNILNTQNNIISPEKQLSFGDLKKLTTIKQAVDYLIDKEIDSLLFESHTAHIEWIGKRLSVDIKNILKEEWGSFTEITERRNLYIHTNGTINDKYLAKCKESGLVLKPTNKYEKGMTLSMSPEYFIQARECLYKISTKIAFLTWKKFGVKEENYIEGFMVNEIIVELIKNGQYDLSISLIEFSEKLLDKSKDSTKRILIVNKALAQKLAGRIDLMNEILNKADWSSCSDDFQLALSLLKNDYDRAFLIFKKLGKNNELLNEDNYLTDPLFAELRKHSDFPKLYKKVFKKDFVAEKPEKIELNLSIKGSSSQK